MADEPEGSLPSQDPAAASEPPKMTTEGARAETAAPKTSSPQTTATPAATSDTFKTTPTGKPVDEVPAVAGGTNAPVVAQPAPKPAPAAAAAAAAATGTTAAATGTAKAPAPAAPPARTAAAKPAAGTAAAGVTRRGFFSWAAVAWVGFTVAIGGCVTAMGRFMFPNVLFEPPTSFKVGRPEDFPPGVVDTRFVDKYGVWIVNDQGRIYSLIAICTHLGCPPAWLDTQNKFKCPCHGSGYYKSGVNFEGPTPRPLERARIFVSPDDGQIVVDKSQKFQWELGQWEDPNSFIPAT
jgi:cytochrome b6-f complex iron-sulfur subunit